MISTERAGLWRQLYLHGLTTAAGLLSVHTSAVNVQEAREAHCSGLLDEELQGSGVRGRNLEVRIARQVEQAAGILCDLVL